MKQKSGIAAMLMTAVTLGRFCRLAEGFSSMQGGMKSLRSKGLSPRRRSKNHEGSHRMVLADRISTVSQTDMDDDTIVLDPLIVCGPSGVGKGTIIAKFMEEMGGDDLFGFTVSHTTRNPREGEVDGRHYHFVAKEFMTEEISKGAFLEYAEVHGNFYGTSWSALRDVQLNAGKRCLLDIDVQGVQNIKEMESDILKPKYVFIAPPSLEELEQRLISRGTESPESLSKRTANARAELEYGMNLGNFDAIVVNRHLDQACHEFSNLVLDMYNIRGEQKEGFPFKFSLGFRKPN